MQLTNHLTEVQLNEYLDGAARDRIQIETHLSSCTECAARLTALRTLFAEVESLTDLPIPRDLSTAVVHKVGSAYATPRWFRWTLALQVTLALITIMIAAPAAIEYASNAIPSLQTPSLTGWFFEAQSLWTGWLDVLSQLQPPSLPEVPLMIDLSGLYLTLALTGAAVLWLVGNGILLKNQIQ